MSFSSTLPFTVHWGDCDAIGIAFYPNFFAWFDNGTWNMFEEAGIPMDGLMRDYNGFGFPLVDAHASFHNAPRPRDRLVLHSRVEGWSDKTVRIAHRVMRGDTLIAEGHEIRVWTVRDTDDPDKLRAEPVPGEIRERFT